MTSRWPKRAPFEHVVDTKTVFDRSLFVPDTYKPGQPSRLRVMYDDDYGLTSIADERTTSESPAAQTIDVAAVFDLTSEEVRWLHRQLSELVDRWDGEAEAPTQACKLCGKDYKKTEAGSSNPSTRTWCDECRAAPVDKVNALLRARKKRYREQKEEG